MKKNFSLKEWQGNKKTRVRTGWGMFTCLFLIVLVPSVSQGGNLEDVLTDIYGGDGITLSVVSGPAHSAHFESSSSAAVNALNSAIVSQLSLFAINSTVAGYSFDTERGVPVRKVKSLGPIFGETANTLGKGRFDFQVTFTRADYTEFNGNPLKSQELILLHPDTPPPGLGNPTFENDTVRIDLNIDVVQEVVAAFFTYGITDNWDVNLVVPVVHNDIKVKAKATIVVGVPSTAPHEFDPRLDPRKSTESGDKTGIGDVVLRTKYNFLKGHDLLPDIAVRGDVTLPTGDEKDLLGTGNFAYRGTLIGSKYFQSEIGPWGPHANLSLQYVENHSDLKNFSWIVGFDIAPHPQFVLAMDFLGRHTLENRNGIGADIVDFAPGFKWAFYKEFLLQSVVQIPVNKNEGLRADAIWTVGVGATF